MIEKTARNGPRPGSRFWGCTRYPDCRGLIPISKAPLAPGRAHDVKQVGPPTPDVRTPAASPEEETERHPTQRAPARHTPASEPEHRMLDYYIACIEAEGRKELTLPRSDLGDRFVLLESGSECVMGSAEGDWRALSRAPAVAAFVKRAGMSDDSEKILYGFPLIAGHRDGVAIVAPLFYTEVESRLSENGNTAEVRPVTDAIEMSGMALELLGLPRSERAEILQALDGAEDEPFRARWRMLEALGLVGESSDPGRGLAALAWQRRGIQPTAVLFVGQRAVVTRQLLEDLEELRRKPVKDLQRGPLGVILSNKPAGQGTLALQPQPAVVPTNFSQDQAISAALERSVTVVTGPPGTGKSQVLVNAVAAAMEAGESVLFASKNNQAVDVVFQRLMAINPEAVPLRAGNRSKRLEMGQRMLDALNRATAPAERDLDPGRSWAIEARGLDPLYRAQGIRAELERRLNALADVCDDALHEVPLPLRTLDDPQPIARALLELEGVLKEVHRKRRFPWLGRRKRRLLQRSAAESWAALKAQLPVSYARLLPAEIPETFTKVYGELAAVTRYMAALAERQRAEREVRDLPDREESAEQLKEFEPTRLAAGRALFAGNWTRKVRRSGATERASVSKYANGLIGHSGAFGRDALTALAGDVIRVFPVWGVTNLSARASLPLTPALFDLLIVDEASQCDVPSAIPLLFRAKRAMVIGDNRQLIHVASLRPRQDEELARQHGVDESTFLDMKYSAVSLFDVASRRVEEQPIFLDEHYRSREAIIRFSNDLFYGSRLVIRTPEEDASEAAAVSWVEATGAVVRGKGGRSFVNEAEAQAVASTIERLRHESQGAEQSLGVVTPFAAQASRIRELVEDPSGNLVVATAHRFQGDERDIMIFSPVLSQGAPDHLQRFVNNANLVNVAVTRARRRLLVVGDRHACLDVGGVIGHLAQYSLDLEDGRFDSPLERKMFVALEEAGLEPRTGVVVAGYRLDLALEMGDRRIDVECDGAVYHRNSRRDNIRDTSLGKAGWEVLRLPGRDIVSDVEACVARVRQLVERAPGLGR